MFASVANAQRLARPQGRYVNNPKGIEIFLLKDE